MSASKNKHPGDYSSSVLISLEELGVEHNRQLIGGKTWNLARLKSAGYPVPNGWVIPSDIFDEHMLASGVDAFARTAQAGTAECCQRISELIQKTDLPESLLRALQELPEEFFAVRSSASVEDGEQASYSGLFRTVLGVNGFEAVIEAVKTVWSSVFTPEVLAYHRCFSAGSRYPSMAVLIMPMISADSAGVAFSANPLTGNPFEIAVSACTGLGTGVVDGSVDCERILLDFDDLHIIDPPENHKQTERVLDHYMLEILGETVRAIDEFLGYRIDVEFAFNAGQLQVLQARKIVGLPAYFPDDPTHDDPTLFVGQQNAWNPIPPLLRIPFLRNKPAPVPPWPPEVADRMYHLGRIIYKKAESPEYRECPEESWRDRSFVKRMMALENPDDDFKEWYPCTEWAYRKFVPGIRRRAECLLRLSPQEFEHLSAKKLAEELQRAFDVVDDALAFYMLFSYPTYEALRRVELLIRDWLLSPPGECWKEAQQVALTLIQGVPKLSHQRDAELAEVAEDECCLDDYICRWGYSYLLRDQAVDFSNWESWRENPAPLYNAIKLLKENPSQKSYKDMICDAQQESDRVYADVCEKLRKADAERGEQKEKVLKACVDACRFHFRLKDDRDLVLSHAQSALRWVLLAIGNRLVKHDIIGQPEDVYLLREHQLSKLIINGNSSSIQIILEQQRLMQQRLKRYSLNVDMATMPVEQESERIDEFYVFPASAGVAEGTVRVIHVEDADSISQLLEGEILVLIGEGKMGWTLYFPIIAGLVYSHGNWLCHETNLCRELGIPAVVGEDCINKIQTGDRIRIDGATGNIKILSRGYAS